MTHGVEFNKAAVWHGANPEEQEEATQTEPANITKDVANQIQEFLDFYGGAGVQHLAFESNDIVDSVARMQAAGVQFLRVPEEYYDEVEGRVGEIDQPIHELARLGILADRDEDGYASVWYGGLDCDDTDPTISPDATDVWYDGVDTDCSGGSDYDADGDGFSSDAYGGMDCDDTTATIAPGVAEIPGDGVDQNCDGVDDVDADGDGFVSLSDCDDTDATVYPGAPDTCYDGVDADCGGDDDDDCDGDDDGKYDAA